MNTPKFNDYFVDAVEYVPTNTIIGPHSPNMIRDEDLDMIFAICDKFYEMCSGRATKTKQVHHLTKQLHAGLRFVRARLFARHADLIKSPRVAQIRDAFPRLCDVRASQQHFFRSRRIDIRDLAFYATYVHFLDRILHSQPSDLGELFRDYLKMKHEAVRTRQIVAGAFYRMVSRFGCDHFDLRNMCSFVLSNNLDATNKVVAKRNDDATKTKAERVTRVENGGT